MTPQSLFGDLLAALSLFIIFITLLTIFGG